MSDCKTATHVQLSLRVTNSMNSKHDRSALLLRIFAGILAILSFLLVALRLYSLAGPGSANEGDDIMNMMRLLFPLSLGMILAYLAIKGRIPFSARDLNESNTPDK
jgi:hypothetical protein